MLKDEIIELKFGNKETEEQVQEWVAGIEGSLRTFDENLLDLRRVKEKITKENQAVEMSETLKQEMALESEKHEQKMSQERDLYEQQLKFQKVLAAGQQNQVKQALSTKLPKLSITQFDGKCANWLPFWNKFVAEIDSADLSPVTKFAYLKEFVEPKVRADIDGLPLTIEGYERAKNILKGEYGKTSEIVNAYVQNILDLPMVKGSDPSEVNNFYKVLLFNVQSLETLGKIERVNGMTRSVLDKLSGIKSDLVKGQGNWQEWDLAHLIAALKQWRDINLSEKENVNDGNKDKRKGKKEGLYNTNSRKRVCVYCDDAKHGSRECTSVVSVDEWKGILARKKLCFNCTGPKHRANECRSTTVCQKCNQKHHTSICTVKESLKVATDGSQGQVVYPVVDVSVEGVICRALLDTGAGSSYASAALLDKLSRRTQTKEVRHIEMMLGSTSREVSISVISVGATDNSYKMDVEVTRVDRGNLLTIANPQYQRLIDSYSHLEGVVMEDKDSKPFLPIHLILGASAYAAIKTAESPRVGQPGEPVAERTRFGWTMMSPGKEFDHSKMLLTQTSQADYEDLCRLDVLGLEDTPEHDQYAVHAEFREQLVRHPEGWYETGLLWKGSHPPLRALPSRLTQLNNKLQRIDLTEKYAEVIEQQKSEGIVETAPEPPTGKEFYIPHKSVIRTEAESTKLRIVYDASARENSQAPSLNDCLYAGPPLQNRLWNVLVRMRFHPVAMTGDIKQAFLQVRIKKEERDSLRFHWKSSEQSEVETLRFTRALFGLVCSPFLLGGVVERHLESWEAREPELVAKIRKSLYVDDLLSGKPTVADAKVFKEGAIKIFEDAKFTLHKWHANVPELEGEQPSMETESTFAKQQLGPSTDAESSLLGLSWNKEADVFSVVVPEMKTTVTKRELLRNLASIYDPLGLVSPVTLKGKTIYRETCKAKTAWDAPLPEPQAAEYSRWVRELPNCVAVPRALTTQREAIKEIELHTFGDASGKGVCAALYAIVKQNGSTNVGLVAARARLAKQDLTIPRLELVSAHMATNLLMNVRQALSGMPVMGSYGWLDSMVALQWLKGGGEYKQFVANRVKKIQACPDITWRHVPSQDNPADLGSRGGRVTGNQLWWKGPLWLTNPNEWPRDVVTTATLESEAEAKATRAVFKVAVESTNEPDQILAKFSLNKALRIHAWISRFLHNCAARVTKQERWTGPLTTQEINDQQQFWVKRAQAIQDDKLNDDKQRLGVQENEEGILVCKGRLQGQCPVFLPDSHPYTTKLVEDAHQRTLHGGVGLTMAKIREDNWVPRLRQLVKKTIKRCHGCRRFHAKPVSEPPPGNLPVDRTEGDRPFQVVGVDFAGPIKYRVTKKTEGKAYITLYACSLTRALYLELTTSMETDEFIPTLKRLIARKGRPEKIYSDNAKTFVAAANWLKKAQQDEKFHHFLMKEKIRWQFNLSRAPWWGGGGEFERMVGLVKSALYKSIGNGCLTKKELQDVLLDIEITLNNRPLGYQEDDIQMPTLTPNALQFVGTTHLPEPEHYHESDPDLRKRAKYLKKCKDHMWSRWTKEYVRTLRERHNLKHNVKPFSLAVGDVIIIYGEERNRGKWPLGIVQELYPGRDGVIRAAKIKTVNGHLDRPVHLLYPLELSCDVSPSTIDDQLNPEAEVFRPTREAAVTARLRIQEQAHDEAD